MKVLIASDLHWPELNGVATFGRNLAHGLADRGHEVVVIAPSQTGKRYKEIDKNHTVYRMASVPFYFYQNYKICVNPGNAIKKIIKDFKPDVIHIQMPMMIGQAAMKYGKRFGVPVVTTGHAMPENLMDNLKIVGKVAKPINYMIKHFGARFHARADYITMPTKAAMSMFGSVIDKVKVPMEPVSNGIDLSCYTVSKPDPKVVEKYKLPKNVPIVTYVGRVDAEKHIWVIIEAFAKVLKEAKAHLLIVGGGTDSEKMQTLTYDLGISDKVTFAGRVSDEDKIELHKVGAVFCITSPVELQSIATLEAMASGKPVVAIDTGALWELCQDGRNGILCRQDDVDQIAGALTKIVSDEKLREKMGKESVAIAKTHDIEYTYKRFEEIYSDVIEKKKSQKEERKAEAKRKRLTKLR